MGYIFFPLAFLMGAGSDSRIVAELMGKKTVLNEFIAYEALGELIDAGKISVRVHGLT